MRILIITEEVPYPAVSGTPLRNYNLIRRIAQEHEVWLAAFLRTPEQAEGVAHLQEFCHAVETAQSQKLGALARPVDLLRYLLTGKPIELRLYHSEKLVSKIRSLISEVDFDVIEIIDSYMALYLEALPQEMSARTILTFIDIVFSKYARIYKLEPRLSRRLRLWLYSRMMRWWEPHYAQRFRRCITVSEVDRHLLLAANPHLRIDVIPNGVDTQAYQPLPPKNASRAVVFVGNMDYRPNVDAVVYFCQEILPRIRRVVPEVEMWIVGINPRPEVRQLDGGGVHVTGRVSDLRPYYSRSAVCVVPLRAGGGTRLKILEAMALGRPVVSTSIGCEGLDVVDGEHLLIADSPEQFAEKTIRLLSDAALSQRITARARELVVARYDWDVIAKKLVKIYAEVAE